MAFLRGAAAYSRGSDAPNAARRIGRDHVPRQERTLVINNTLGNSFAIPQRLCPWYEN